MTPDAAYDQAMHQFQACLAASGWDGLGLCGWDAGSAYGSWSALGAIHAWQAAAWFALALAALGWALAAWLLWQSRKKVPAC